MNFFALRPRAALVLLLATPVCAVAALALTLRRTNQLRAELDQAQNQAVELRQRAADLDPNAADLPRATQPPEPVAPPAKPPPPPPAAAPVTHVAYDRNAVLAAIETLRARGDSPKRPPVPVGLHGNVYFPELFGDPAYAALFAASMRQRNDVRYAPLFQSLADTLAPYALERFRQLLLEQAIANEEVDGILQNQALLEKKPFDSRESLKLKQQVRETFTQEIKQSFGDAVFSAWRTFNNGADARQTFIDALELRLSYSGTPLDDTQAARLVQPFNANRGRDDTFSAAARGILFSSQWPALDEIQAELQASRTYRVMVTPEPSTLAPATHR
jgi:hypothetical protein